MKNTNGFTLIEVLIALLILAFSMTVLMQSWGGNFRAIKKARTYSIVTQLLQKKVIEFELLNKKKSALEIPEEEKGDFGSDYPEYRWEIKTQPFKFPNLFPMPENSSDGDMAQKIIKEMQDYFEKTVREVSVTVIQKAAKREVKYTINTFFVEYDQELPLGN
ncbi:MAG: type II secretion system protein [Oligoflexia bacterium]|nr:type II secretion system protein [Oligoflexia bacterium]